MCRTVCTDTSSETLLETGVFSVGPAAFLACGPIVLWKNKSNNNCGDWRMCRRIPLWKCTRRRLNLGEQHTQWPTFGWGTQTCYFVWQPLDLQENSLAVSTTLVFKSPIIRSRFNQPVLITKGTLLIFVLTWYGKCNVSLGMYSENEWPFKNDTGQTFGTLHWKWANQISLSGFTRCWVPIASVKFTHSVKIAACSSNTCFKAVFVTAL